MTKIVLELEHEEAETLLEALEIAVSEMGMEIADTDRKTYRDEIKVKRDFLADIRERLEATLKGAGL